MLKPILSKLLVPRNELLYVIADDSDNHIVKYDGKVFLDTETGSLVDVVLFVPINELHFSPATEKRKFNSHIGMCVIGKDKNGECYFTIAMRTGKFKSFHTNNSIDVVEWSYMPETNWGLFNSELDKKR